MTPKQRILAALRGEETDRIPWSPFLAYWWEAQDETLRAQGQLNYMESIGADPMLRGFTTAFRLKYNHLERHTKTTPTEQYEDWETPVGTLRFRSVLSRGGNTWFLVDHPVQEPEDLKTLAWLYEHAELEYSRESEEAVKETGERGLLVPLLGTEGKTCFQSLVERYAGIQNLSYLLADAPEEVDACLFAMRRLSDKTAEYAAASGADAYIFWEDSSTTSISPALFEKYTAPEISAWAKPIHEAGSLLIHHACGHLRQLLPLMAGTGADAIESISPPTTGNIDIPEAFSLLPENIALVGGIEPVFYETCTEEALAERVRYLLETTKGRRYVLANSDSCPPGVSESKLKAVSGMITNMR